MIPELDIRVSAGGGALDEDEQVVAEWFVPAKLVEQMGPGPSPSLKIITVYGDSMTPDYPPHTRVMVDINDCQPSPAGVFVTFDGMARVLKRIEFIEGSDPPAIELSSINPAYRKYQRTLEEARILGRVVGKWTWT